MTLARRMWLASAALALLVGAAFTALILAVSAQREATDREARSQDVSAASLQLEKLVSDVESSFLSFTVTGKDSSLEAYRQARAKLQPQLRELNGLVRSDPRAEPARAGDREPGPGVRLLLRRRRLIPLLREEPGLTRDDSSVAQQNKIQTDEIRRLFDRFRTRREHARGASEPGRRPPHGHRRARRRHRGRGLDGADRPLRDRAGALDRPSGARRRRRSQQDRRRRALAPAAGGGPRRGRRADTRVQRDGGAARGRATTSSRSRTRSCARASAGRPSSSASSPTSCARRSRACSGSRRCC